MAAPAELLIRYHEGVIDWNENEIARLSRQGYLEFPAATVAAQIGGCRSAIEAARKGLEKVKEQRGVR